MPFSANDLLWGLAAPLILAAGLRLLLVWITKQFASTNQGDSDSPETETPAASHVSPLETAIPLIAGAAVGYFMLKLGPSTPDAHYEWFPLAVGIVVIVATVIGLLGSSSPVRFGVLPVGYAAAAIGVGYLLMPTWEDLSPPYLVYLEYWCVGVILISVVTELSPESRRWPFAVVWLGTCLAVAGIVAISESLRFAQIAGLTIGASVGLIGVGFFLRRSLMGGLGLTLTTYLAGILLIAHVNSWSDVPLVSYWLPLAGPLAAAVLGMILPAKVSPAIRATLVILAAAIPSTVAVILGIVATLPE